MRGLSEEWLWCQWMTRSRALKTEVEAYGLRAPD